MLIIILTQLAKINDLVPTVNNGMQIGIAFYKFNNSRKSNNESDERTDIGC